MFTGNKTPTATHEKPRSGYTTGNVLNTPNPGKYADFTGSGSASHSSSRAMSIYFSDAPAELEKYDKFLISVRFSV